jgi:hypothetical protein
MSPFLCRSACEAPTAAGELVPETANGVAARKAVTACSSVNVDAALSRPDWFPLTPSQKENHVATDNQCVLVPDSCSLWWGALSDDRTGLPFLIPRAAV